jgi:ADP-ribose pyrophosphatase
MVKEKVSFMTFTVLDSKLIYQGRAFSVRRDHVALPDGGSAWWDIVDHVDSIMVIPVDADGYIWFVRQYRHPATQEVLEMPAGVLESGESPETCAHREIREETGMAAGKLQKIGEFFLAAGYSSEYMHVYLATDLRPDPLQADADEFLSVEKISIAEAYRIAENNQVRDAKTLAGLFLSRPYLFPHL